jgi:hypothetical protein
MGSKILTTEAEKILRLRGSCETGHGGLLSRSFPATSAETFYILSFTIGLATPNASIEYLFLSIGTGYARCMYLLRGISSKGYDVSTWLVFY